MISEEKINKAISTNEKVFLENLRTIMQIPSVKGSSNVDLKQKLLIMLWYMRNGEMTMRIILVLLII